MKKIINLFIALPLLFLIVACSKGKDSNEGTGQDTKNTPVPKDTNSPTVPTVEIAKLIEYKFRHLTCISKLTPISQQIDEKGVNFSATFDCSIGHAAGDLWDESRIDSFLNQLTAIDDNIKILKERKDAHQTDINMANAIGDTIYNTLNDLREYKKKYNSDLELANELQKQLGCVRINDSAKPYSCPTEALDKFEEVYSQLFGGIHFGARLVPGINFKSMRNNYAPEVLRKKILDGVSELLKNKYPQTFNFSSESGSKVKSTTITMWLAMDLSFTLTKEVNDDFYSPTTMTAQEIKIVMANIRMLGEQGNILVQRLHDVHSRSWLDIRFISGEAIRQISQDGARFFAKIHEPITLDSLIAETKFVDQISNELKTSFENANNFFHGE